MDEGRLNWLRLAMALGPGAQNATEANDLLVETGDPTPVMTKAQGARWNGTTPESMRLAAGRCAAVGVQLLTWADDAYPERLRQIESAPPVLFYQGDIRLLAAPLLIGMVGTRRPSAYGAEAVGIIGRGLAKQGAVIVSGLAAGLDSEGHKAALSEDAPTVACIAFGHGHCYPKQNLKLMQVISRCGLVIGEYPPDTEPERAFFLQRNRLIAALSHGLVVAEARARSGTMSTVNFAAEFGRDVFAVPGPITSALSTGTNAMIREGAHVATCAEDILHLYGMGPEECEEKGGEAVLQEEEPVSEGAARVLAVLGSRPQPIEAVCIAAGVSPREAMAALTELELMGKARREAGGQYTARI